MARLGVRDYITKPFSEELLLAKVARAISLVARPTHDRRERKPAPQSKRAGDAEGPVTAEAPKSATELAEASSAPIAVPLQRASVLVVDDSRTMRLSLIRALNELGFDNIKEAKNGRQALELVLKEHFDLMLLDMEMPEMNGMEVLLALKNNPQLERVAGHRNLRGRPDRKRRQVHRGRSGGLSAKALQSHFASRPRDLFHRKEAPP